MASVVAARDEKEKERRDASVNLRARPRASSVLPCAPVRAELSLEKLVFQDKISPLVGCRAGRRDFAPDFATCSSMRTKSGPTYPVSKWKTVEDEPLPAVVGGARRVAALLFRLFGSCFGARCFFRRFALKSGRLRRPHHRLGHRGPVRGPARSSGIGPLARKRTFVGLPDTPRSRLQPGADPSGTRRPTTNRRRF